MVPRKEELIVNISSFGGLRIRVVANDVAYGVGKAALDRPKSDMAHELKKHNVCCVTLWPGTVKTELVGDRPGFENGETPEFTGRCVVAISENLDAIFPARTGRVLLSTELAKEFHFTDLDGKLPNSHPADLREKMATPPRHWVFERWRKVLDQQDLERLATDIYIYEYIYFFFSRFFITPKMEHTQLFVSENSVCFYPN